MSKKRLTGIEFINLAYELGAGASKPRVERGTSWGTEKVFELSHLLYTAGQAKMLMELQLANNSPAGGWERDSCVKRAVELVKKIDDQIESPTNEDMAFFMRDEVLEAYEKVKKHLTNESRSGKVKTV